MTSMRQFRAFISYCHADRAFAAKLQHRLESYRLPRQLAPRLAPIADESPGRLGPVFRDRADLSADEDLSRAVRAAIASSSALVLVASPDAARSRWVRREIDLFRELHPEAPILVALVRGEPDDALPAVIRDDGREPLAADFRREGDGDRLAFLKIVGGLAGLPLDALVQRDAQRQLRRVTAVTLGAGVLVIVMGLLLVMAMQARKEAEDRRAGAEGLVDFMRTTLREQLKGEGSVPVMRAVNERALAYFDGQGDPAKLPDESILLRSMVLHALGEDDLNGGRDAEAKKKFGQAYAATQAVRAHHPRDADAIFADAQSEFWMGRAARAAKDRATVTRFWAAYRTSAATLADVEPGSNRSLMELGYAEGNLCDLDLENHNFASALRHCRESVRYERSALAAGPKDRNGLILDIANRYGWIARVQLAQHDFAAAIVSRRQEAALLDPLIAAQPHNAQYAMHRVWPDLAIGKILIDTGRPQAAATLLAVRWTAFDPKLNDDSSKDFWKSGLKIQLFLAKAERIAQAPSYAATAARVEIWVARYLALFPGERSATAALRKDIG